MWNRLAAVWTQPANLLELNCGTGADAVWLAQQGHTVHATDVSPAMLRQTQAAIASAGMSDRVRTGLLALEDLGTFTPESDSFEGILSNFGGLNCVVDLGLVIRSMAQLLEPRGRAVLCIMGPTVPWEWAWFLAHGEPSKAIRRLHRDPQWQGRPLRYPSVATLRRLAAANFLVDRVSALGAIVPPPYAEQWAQRHAEAIRRLNSTERRWETNRLLTRCADHYLVELVRK